MIFERRAPEPMNVDDNWEFMEARTAIIREYSREYCDFDIGFPRVSTAACGMGPDFICVSSVSLCWPRRSARRRTRRRMWKLPM